MILGSAQDHDLNTSAIARSMETRRKFREEHDISVDDLLTACAMGALVQVYDKDTMATLIEIRLSSEYVDVKTAVAVSHTLRTLGCQRAPVMIYEKAKEDR